MRKGSEKGKKKLERAVTRVRGSVKEKEEHNWVRESIEEKERALKSKKKQWEGLERV